MRSRRKERRKPKNLVHAKRFLCFSAAFGAAMYILCRAWLFQKEERVVDVAKLEYVVALPSDKSALVLQLEQPIRAFKKSDADISEDEKFARKKYVIVQSRLKKSLVASVFIHPTEYQSSDNNPAGLCTIFEIYNLYVVPGHRGKRLSIAHLYRSLRLASKVYGVDKKKCYVVLHISPMDKDMPKAFALYRTSGFFHGLFTPHGCYSLRNVSEVFQRAQSVDAVLRDYMAEEHSSSREKKSSAYFGLKYFCMFSELSAFFASVELSSAYSRKDYVHHLEKAKALQKQLLRQHVY